MTSLNVRRRQFCLPAVLLVAAAPGADRTSPITAAELERDVAAYDRFGIKQTGGPGNLATVRWAARRLAALGYDVSVRSFDQPSFRIDHASVMVGRRMMAAFPLFPPHFTGRSGIAGPLFLWDGRAPPSDAAGKIALLLLPEQRHSSTKISFKGIDLAAAARTGMIGLVAVTRGPTGDLIALNADSHDALPPIPVLLVAGREAEPLQAAAQRGERTTLLLRGRKVPTGQAKNVVAQRVRGPKWIVISTPLSGWFHATAERGPGVAIFLALADRLARAAPCDSIALVATSGHESGYGGMAAAIDAGLLPRPAATRLWVHLGAGLAAVGAPAPGEKAGPAETVRYMLATPAAIDATRAAFTGVAGYDKPYPVDRSSALGETEVVIGRGYPRVVGGLSAHLYHHSRRDRTDRTSGALILPVAQGFERLVNAEADRTSCR